MTSTSGQKKLSLQWVCISHVCACVSPFACYSLEFVLWCTLCCRFFDFQGTPVLGSSPNMNSSLCTLNFPLSFVLMSECCASVVDVAGARHRAAWRLAMCLAVASWATILPWSMILWRLDHRTGRCSAVASLSARSWKLPPPPPRALALLVEAQAASCLPLMLCRIWMLRRWLLSRVRCQTVSTSSLLRAFR